MKTGTMQRAAEGVPLSSANFQIAIQNKHPAVNRVFGRQRYRF